MKTEKERMKEWVDNWKITGEILEKIRIKEIRETNTIQAILNFDLAFQSAIRMNLARKVSGLGKFHEILKKMYK